MNHNLLTDTNQSFEKSAIPLLLALEPSRILLVAIIACHAAAIVAVLLSNIALPLQLLATAAIAVSVCYNYLQDSQRQVLIWRAGNRWVIGSHPVSTLQGLVRQFKTTLLRSSPPGTVPKDGIAAELVDIDFFSRWLIILTLRTESARRRKFVIPCDSLSNDKFRLLRVRLRIEGFGLLNPMLNPDND